MRLSSIGIGIGLGLLVSCAPDLAANGAPRCEESLECAAGSLCYRGFCVPDDGTVGDAGEGDVEDASQTALPQPEHDAGITPATEVSDASTAATDPSQQPDAAAPQLGPTAPAASSMPAPAPSTPAPSTPAPSTPDAGPIVVDLPGNCTLAECCAEARASLPVDDSDDDDESSSGPGPAAGPKEKAEPEPKPKKVKACGCADPGLLSGVLCGLLGPLGV